MEKWVRRGIQAALTAGAVGVASVGAAQADDTTVAPRTVSETVSVAGSNGILVGNSVSVPIVIPITDNKAAITGIGAAINGENALISAGILGNAHACQSGGDNTNVSPFVRSSSTSVVGDNHIGSGNAISVPIVAPITGNDVAVAGIGAAANVVDLVAALGILGNAHAGDCDEEDNGYGNGGHGNGGHGNGGHGNGGYGYGNGSHGNGGHGNGGHGNGGYGEYGDGGYSEHGSGDSTTVAGSVKSQSASWVGDNSILSGNSLSVPVYAPITGNDVAVAGIGGAVNADTVTAALGILGNASAGGGGNGLLGDVASLAGLPAGETAPASAELSDASLHSAGDSTVVTPNVKSESTSVVGDNSIGSGNSISAPVVVPVTDNKVAVAGIGGAVNGEDVTAAVGVLGNAEAEDSGAAGDETVVAPTVKSQSTSVVGDNSILSGNSVSAPVVAPVTGNDVAVAGIGGAVNAEDVTVVGAVLGTASALLGG